MGNHILMVEDDTFITQMYSTKLEGEGFEVDVCPNAEKGIKIARKYHSDLDLILLDIILPGKNGIEMLEEIMGDEQLKDIPVVILSNLASQNDVEKCLDMGAADYIVKSNYTPDEISRLIKKYV